MGDRDLAIFSPMAINTLLRSASKTPNKTNNVPAIRDSAASVSAVVPECFIVNVKHIKAGINISRLATANSTDTYQRLDKSALLREYLVLFNQS